MTSRAETRAPPGESRAAARRRRWRGPLAGLLTILVVGVPVMAVAEDWRGHPMIDDAGAWWLVPAAVAVAAFFTGGAIAVRRPGAGAGAWSGPGRAVRRIRSLTTGMAVGLAAATVLVAADGVRRILFDPTLPAGVVDYWLEASAVAVVASALGAVVASRTRPAAH